MPLTSSHGCMGGGDGGVFAAMFLTSSWRARGLQPGVQSTVRQPSMLVTKAEAVVVAEAIETGDLN